MTELPAPMTPADCDLRDFAFMPLDVRRLLTSETWVLGEADEKVAALSLWCEAWHQVPAASLPENERMLAHLSGAGQAGWKKVRDHALRGWIKCSDGRLYHPVVAEKAIEAWAKKETQRVRSRKANAARWKNDPSSTPQGAVEACNKDAEAVPNECTEEEKTIQQGVQQASLNDPKGQGQREGQGQKKEPPDPHCGADAPMGDEDINQSGRKAPFSRGSRADGSNPRAVAAAVKATAAALKSKETLAKVEAHALWPAFSDRLSPAEFAGTIGACEYRNGADPPVLIAPSRFLRDHIRTQFRQRLERFDARIRVEFAAAAEAPSAPVIEAQAESVA